MKWVMTLLLLWCAGAAAAGLDIREGYVREMPPGQSTSAAFMKLVNGGSRPIAIVAAASDAAAAAELHGSTRHDGMVQMQHVARLEVPAHGQVVLAPGGYHLMLINLKRTLHAGEKVGITLFDEEGRSYRALLPVINMLGGTPQRH